MHERGGVYTKMDRQPLTGRSLLGQTLPSLAAKVSLAHPLSLALGRAKGPQSHPLEFLVQEACGHSSSLPCPAQSPFRPEFTTYPTDVVNLPACGGAQGGHLLPAQLGQLLLREGPLEKMGPEGIVGGTMEQISITCRGLWDWALPKGGGGTRARQRTSEELGLTQKPPPRAQPWLPT